MKKYKENSFVWRLLKFLPTLIGSFIDLGDTEVTTLGALMNVTTISALFSLSIPHLFTKVMKYFAASSVEDKAKVHEYLKPDSSV